MFPNLSGDNWGYCMEGNTGNSEVIFYFYGDTTRWISFQHGKKLWGKLKDCNWEKYE